MGSFRDLIKNVFTTNRLVKRLNRKDHLRMLEEVESYAPVISRYLPYFNELSNTEKARFLQRVYRFKKKKKFHYIGIERNSEIPILISAAAIQISFGLKKYRMQYFKNIYITADMYTYGLSSQPWVGHVNRNGIYISWKHFIHGYTHQHDRDNVGIHEMAHALEYVATLDSIRADGHFVRNFSDYKILCEKIMRDLKGETPPLFTAQGMTNFHEFWAECAELFFENPTDLHQHYPALYDATRVLLNQDPMNGFAGMSEPRI